ncbi:hypothetical protein BDZ94DRAFT_1325981 [Collybia nuda]|uniref:Uncharacterized protein n=1 Tax=Collybia nuda TaxID=64659 RepID=A0A9P6CA28_9AGAR|nr:hypothetical protein BDZ94DRAFT_1325981 [Collybia nuda]
MGIVYTFIFSLLFIATIYNIIIIRRVLHEKQEIAEVMMEVLLELRAAAQRSNRKSNQVITSIRDLHTEMQDNHEILTKMFDYGRPKHIVTERPLSDPGDPDTE